MNTILLQKILDILKEGLAHVGNFFKDLFISDPQDGQVIGYDAEEGKWKNMNIAELSFDVTNQAGPAETISLSDAASDIAVRSFTVDIEPQQAAGTPTPSVPLPISGTSTIVITHTYGDNETETVTVNLGSTIYVGWYDVTTGKLIVTHLAIPFNSPELTWIYQEANTRFYTTSLNSVIKSTSSAVLMPEGFKCECYNPHPYAYIGNLDISVATSGNIFVKDTNYTDVTDWLNAIGTQKFLYPLATPIEYTLTPTTITTQGGSETFAADAGNIEMEYYTKAAGDIKSLVSISEDITDQITVNTTDWSNLQYKIVKNNNVVTIYLYSATTTEHGSVELFSGLPRAAYNGPVLLFDTDNNAVVNAKVDTSGYLDVTLAAGGTVKGTITYVAK